MGGRAFIFSLDAFVAFVLMAVAVSLIIFVSGTPKAAYLSLEQAHQLAHDTLQSLASSSDDASKGSYLEQIINRNGDTPTILRRVAGGDPHYSGIIPYGYGYRLEAYDFQTKNWASFYDAGADRLSDRFGKNYTKLSASATNVMSIYKIYPKPGYSPYCNLNCRGYGVDAQGIETFANPCNATPCDAMLYPLFQPGSHSIQLVRLVVYT